MPNSSKIDLKDRVKLKLAQMTLSIIAASEALKEAQNLPPKQKKAVEDIHAAYEYAYTQIQDVAFPLDCTQADVDNAMVELGEIIDKSKAMQDAIQKLKSEILKAAKDSKK